jgi:anti-sigma regulatory factor (Ser/Thr protein kinase)
LVVVAAARRAGLGDDQIDDVRLAVGEAVSRAVVRHIAQELTSEVSIEISESADSFDVQVTDSADETSQDSAEDVALALIRAIVPNVMQAGSALTLRWTLAS